MKNKKNKPVHLTDKQKNNLKCFFEQFHIRDVEIPDDFTSEIAFDNWKLNTIRKGLK